jgi:hypothetical protein
MSSQALPAEAGDSSSLVESFDWRTRHGADNPDSPYYHRDSSGSDRLTPVKRQRCNQCWVFLTGACRRGLCESLFQSASGLLETAGEPAGVKMAAPILRLN